jgi:L,D-peptidoglycan transpeptidase YkuD (ErfK/YbiS/YcfS/YnhG family)
MDLFVSRRQGKWQGRYGARLFPCAVGRSGLARNKREGDGATPIGCFTMRYLLFRPDRLDAPQTAGLPVRALAPQHAWCDDPADPHYNQPVNLPFAASHEVMWREDGLYDLVVVLGYNDDPVVPERGSAIFLHIGHEDLPPTEGCVAMRRADLLQILSSATARARVCVLAD